MESSKTDRRERQQPYDAFDHKDNADDIGRDDDRAIEQVVNEYETHYQAAGLQRNKYPPVGA
jgi:hypothetical protein